MTKTVRYLVSLSPTEVVAKFRELEELGDVHEFALVPAPHGFTLQRSRTKPPFEDYELAPLELRVVLKTKPQGTLVVARAAATPRWRGIAIAIGNMFGHVGGSLVADALNLGKIRERRRKERSQLLNLVARAVAGHELGEPKGPYRDRASN